MWSKRKMELNAKFIWLAQWRAIGAEVRSMRQSKWNGEHFCIFAGFLQNPFDNIPFQTLLNRLMNIRYGD